MSGDWDEDLCKKALVLVEELCFNSPRGYSQSERCQEFTYMLRGRNRLDTEISVSLLSVIVTFCGIVLLSVSLFVSWKLCWLPWRDKEGGGLSLTSGLLPGSAGVGSLEARGGRRSCRLCCRGRRATPRPRSTPHWASRASTTPTSLTWWGWRGGKWDVWLVGHKRPRSIPTWTWTPTPTTQVRKVADIRHYQYQCDCEALADNFSS
ncbi:unnamed protein product [Pleuronectes platessa]|uniref:Uncharacterized protein n=1 Tax=Pleuronectes platessa TaxID=8262 RepID=A0A9N7V4Q5_PLEPL|nr:unnamed protein product [Pleuronectes platessa]